MYPVSFRSYSGRYVVTGVPNKGLIVGHFSSRR